MNDAGSLNRITFWRGARETILQKMEKDIISPERAEKILSFIRITLRNVSNLKELGEYIGLLSNHFKELRSYINGLKLKEDEKLDNVVSKTLDMIMNEGQFDLAEKLMNLLGGIDNVGKKIEEVKTFCPKEFEESYRNVFGEKEY